jgi:hypothetical protein
LSARFVVELDVIAPAVVRSNCGVSIDHSLADVRMRSRSFPNAPARRAGIVGDHRRPPYAHAFARRMQGKREDELADARGTRGLGFRRFAWSQTSGFKLLARSSAVPATRRAMLAVG